ncbi:MAG: GvpL/GvpF family gas vesicle protein [Thermoguttaceae bacterium]|jgi:hypothetical protein
MDEPYYLYALTWANCLLHDFGPEVDPRYPVVLVRYGRLAAVASRVGLDQFDLAGLQQETLDMAWLSKVALRHHGIINALAQQGPVLPMRLGTLFASRKSLLAKLTPFEADAARFLTQLTDRQEWAVKIYADHENGTVPLPSASTGLRADAAHGGLGTSYLAAQGRQAQRRRRREALVGQAAATVEARLTGIAEACRRLRPLAQTFTNRPETMVWNAAFLLARSAAGSFCAACAQLRGQFAPEGLSVETTGPWPAYHFCPSFESVTGDAPSATAGLSSSADVPPGATAGLSSSADLPPPAALLGKPAVVPYATMPGQEPQRTVRQPSRWSPATHSENSSCPGGS